MNSADATPVVAYVSTPHAGYLKFFRNYEGHELYLFGREIIERFPSLVRHLPGNTPEELRAMISALGIFSEVRVLEPDMLSMLGQLPRMVMPDEDVSHALAEEYFGDVKSIFFDGRWRLRWDANSILRLERPEKETVVFDEHRWDMIRQAFGVARQSTDWWRQVGGILAKDGKILLAAFNKHQPSEQSPYLFGDPRSQFDAGQSIEVSTALHAEVGILAEAARKGISTEGLDLWITVFPCPPCAYAVARAGIKRLFYAEGYSRLEGVAALENAGVEIIRVVMGE